MAEKEQDKTPYPTESLKKLSTKEGILDIHERAKYSEPSPYTEGGYQEQEGFKSCITCKHYDIESRICRGWELWDIELDKATCVHCSRWVIGNIKLLNKKEILETLEDFGEQISLYEPLPDLKNRIDIIFKALESE